MKIPLNIDWQQILLHLFNFLFLVAALYLLLYKPVKNFMDKRTEYYAKMDEQAKAELSQAEQLKATYQENLDQVSDEIGQRKSRAAQEAQTSAAALLHNAEKQAAKVIADAQYEAEQARTKILDGAQEEIARLAISATEKLLAQAGSDPLDQFLDTVQKE